MTIKPEQLESIIGATGQTEIPPLTIGELATAIKELSDPVNLRDLSRRKKQNEKKQLGISFSPCRLDTAGWGLVFAEDADPQIEEALSELIKHRESQAGEKCRVFFKNPKGVHHGQTKDEWLKKHGVAPAEVEPDKVPYYLLLVGSPEAIPFEFQSHLAVDYAVGRIHFNTLQEYANYARSVVLAETEKEPWLPRRIAFYGAVNGDADTQNLRQALIDPVSAKIRDRVARNLDDEGGLNDPGLWPGPCPKAAGLVSDWQVETYIDQEATRNRLLELLGGNKRAPALLFTGGHGYEPANVACMPFEQGALISSDWDCKGGASAPRNTFVSGEDISPDANLLGMIAFFFACYSGGTPEEADEIFSKIGKALAKPPHPFIARLPAKMLSAPGGGALAVIASVAPTFSIAYQWPGVGEIHRPFEDCLTHLLRGYPIGHAIRPFSDRHASHTKTLCSDLILIRKGKAIPDVDLIHTWLASYISGYQIIIGDPAVRLSPTTHEANPDLPTFTPKAVAGAPLTDSWPDELPDPCRGTG
jgi:hypothetical protein